MLSSELPSGAVGGGAAGWGRGAAGWGILLESLASAGCGGVVPSLAFPTRIIMALGANPNVHTLPPLSLFLI